MFVNKAQNILKWTRTGIFSKNKIYIWVIADYSNCPVAWGGKWHAVLCCIALNAASIPFFFFFGDSCRQNNQSHWTALQQSLEIIPEPGSWNSEPGGWRKARSRELQKAMPVLQRGRDLAGPSLTTNPNDWKLCKCLSSPKLYISLGGTPQPLKKRKRKEAIQNEIEKWNNHAH